MNKATLHPSVKAKALAVYDAEASAAAMLNATMRAISAIEDEIGHNPPSEQSGLEEIARLNERMRRQQERGRNATAIAATVRHFLESLPASMPVETVDPVKAKPAKGQSIIEAINELREKITGVLKGQNRILRSDLTIASKKALVREHVQQMARAGTPYMNFTDGKLTLTFTPTSGAADPAVMLAYLDPNQLIERLHEQIDRMPKTDQLHLSPKDKQDALKRVAAELEELERTECALIDLAAEQGTEVPYRLNTSVPAILGIRLTKRAKVAA